MQKKKCVLLLSRFPTPPLGGYKLKTYQFVKILSRLFDLHIIVITDEKPDDVDMAFLKQYSIGHQIFSFPKWRSYWNTMTTLLFSKKPLQVGYYYVGRFKPKIAELLASADVVIPSLTRTTEYTLGIEGNAIKVLDMIDSYALSYTRSKKKTRSFFWKWMYKTEADRLERYERKLIGHFDHTLLVNQDEVDHWKPHGNCSWLPNGVDDRLFNYELPSAKTENAIAFFGKMDYPPNVDAVKWYIEHVLEHLPSDIKFYVIGVAPNKKVLKMGRRYDNVIVTGFVEDPYTLLSQCLAVIAPMQTGGGLQNKVLEAMALGQVNILSSLAAAPIGGKDGTHYLVADTAEHHITYIQKLQNDPAYKNAIGNNARLFIQDNFSWHHYEDKLRELLIEKPVR